MAYDVDYITVRCQDEEPAHPMALPLAVHNLVAESLGFFIGTFDVIGVDGNDRVFRCGRVARYELIVRPGVGPPIPC